MIIRLPPATLLTTVVLCLALAVRPPSGVAAEGPGGVAAPELAAQLARAELLLRTGRGAEALPQLAQVAAADWPCRGTALVLLSRAQLQASQAAEALASASAAQALPGAHRIEAAWLAASAQQALSQPEAADAFMALAAADSGLDEQRRGQALVTAATLLESAGRKADAARALRRAALERPDLAPDDALARAAALAASAGITLPPLTSAQRVDRARALRAANLHERAVAAYRDAERGLTGTALAAVKLARAKSLFDLRQNEPARAACAEVVKIAPGTAAAAEARLVSARAAWRVDDGAAVLAQVDAGLRDPRLAKAEARPDLWLVRGNYWLEKRRYEDAVKAFASLLHESPRSPKAGEARWRIAWCRLHQGRPSDAAAEFARLAKEQQGGDLERIGALWAALSRERAGGDATDELLSVASRWPWTYQGEQARALLASRLDAESRAAREAEWAASGDALVPPAPPALPGDAGARYVLLRDAGLHAWALPELESLWPGRSKDDALAFELARARARAGRASEAQALLRSRFPAALERPSRRTPPELWEVVYPLPLPDLVATKAAEHRVDPALCAAIIRSESSWDPSARSWADARGLMQLVPATAAKLAAKEGLSGFEPDMLFDPAVNVALGARHLGDLLLQFRGDLDAAIASYNAGEDKVAQWWAEFDAQGVPAIERVERIPYRETRQYVRRVRDAMSWYAWLLACDEEKGG